MKLALNAFDPEALPKYAEHYPYAEKFYADVMRSTMAEGRSLMTQNAALAWVIEKTLVSKLADLTVVVGGMGVPEGYVDLGAEGDSRTWLERYSFAVRSPYTDWRGLNLRGISGEDGFFPYDLFPALESARPLLSQETFDFLVCRDLQGAKLGAVVKGLMGDEIISLYRTKATEEEIAKVRVLSRFQEEEADLIYAFRKQMLDEAQPFTARVASGVYLLERTPLPKLDKHLVYDSLRLVITPSGIVGAVICSSFVRHAVFAPFFWSPGGLNTSQVWYPPECVFGIEALCACIWRDACVVREQWSDRAARAPVEFRSKSPSPLRSPKALILPRRLYPQRWGTNPVERAAVEQVSRAAHHVRASYVKLPEEWEAHAAAERAALIGWPAPPAGYTFRAAHQRGGEKAEATLHRKIICKGLLTATLLFGKEAEPS